MNNNKYYADEIKTRLKMPEILRFYGFNIKRGNRIPCPFHSGNDANCGVKNDYIHCFVCGESADQIGFVQKYFNLSFSDAIRKINDDFCLGLPIGNLSFDALRTIHFNQKALQAKREREKREREKADAEYWAAFDEWKRLDDNRRIYKPKFEDEELHPLFVESLQKIAYQEYILDILDKRRVS